MKKYKHMERSFSIISYSCVLALAGVFSLNDLSAQSLAKDISTTSLSVTNQTGEPVYANLVIGEGGGCKHNIASLDQANFVSSLGKSVSFVGPEGLTDKGAYQLSAGETITYQPKTVSCDDDDNDLLCSPAFTGNFYFTRGFNGTKEGNPGCGQGSRFPNAANLAEFSINFPVSGGGAKCGTTEAVDISAVNGVNSTMRIETTGNGWPADTSAAENGPLGHNSNRPGVFGWAATNCNSSQNPPNPTATCKAPNDAPLKTGSSCSSVVDGKYCAQISNPPQCLNQRTADMSGGLVKITFKGPIPGTVDEPSQQPLLDNASAQQICPSVCTGAGGTWSGQWTNIIQPNVCGCNLE